MEKVRRQRRNGVKCNTKLKMGGLMKDCECSTRE